MVFGGYLHHSNYRFREEMRNVKVFCLLVVLVSISTLMFKYIWIDLYRNERDLLYQHIINNGKNHETYTSSNETKKDNSFAATILKNDKRRKKVRERCAYISKTMTSEQKHRYKNIHKFQKQFIRGLTDKHFSLIYCRVNKAASYYAISTLSKLLNISQELFHGLGARFRGLPYHQRKKVFKSAYTFLFVREPYGRLFSAYCNKFYFPKGNWVPVGTEIVKRYRKDPSEDSLQFGHDITFVELIRFIVDEFEVGHKIDPHINPMHANCKPCEYEYDFIGKLETIVPDWQYLVQQLKARNIILDIPPNAGEKNSKAKFLEMIHFQSTLSKVRNSNINIYSLYKRAWRYYQITSIISKHIEMPFKDISGNKIKHSSFIEALKRAYYISNVNSPNLISQRHEAMLQAYSAVPVEVIEKIRNVVLEDCLLYGYEDRPKWLFDREKWLFDRENIKSNSNTFNYFTDLN